MQQQNVSRPLQPPTWLRNFIGHQDIADLPTRHTGAIRPVSTGTDQTATIDHLQPLPGVDRPSVSSASRTGLLQPLTPVDTSGRVYMTAIDPDANTVALVSDLVSRFYQMNGRYPKEILLSALRYLQIRYVSQMSRAFYPCPGAPAIPYVYEPNYDYDVKVRG